MGFSRGAKCGDATRRTSSGRTTGWTQEMEESKDSVRIYRLMEPRGEHTWLAGKQPRFDLHDPLLV